MPGQLQGITEVPLSKIPNPQNAHMDELVSLLICSWDGLQHHPRDPERDKGVKKEVKAIFPTSDDVTVDPQQ